MTPAQYHAFATLFDAALECVGAAESWLDPKLAVELSGDVAGEALRLWADGLGFEVQSDVVQPDSPDAPRAVDAADRGARNGVDHLDRPRPPGELVVTAPRDPDTDDLPQLSTDDLPRVATFVGRPPTRLPASPAQPDPDDEPTVVEHGSHRVDRQQLMRTASIAAVASEVLDHASIQLLADGCAATVVGLELAERELHKLRQRAKRDAVPLAAQEAVVATQKRQLEAARVRCQALESQRNAAEFEARGLRRQLAGSIDQFALVALGGFGVGFAATETVVPAAAVEIYPARSPT